MEIDAKTDIQTSYEIMKAASKEKPTSQEKKALRELLDRKPEIWQEVCDLAGAVQNRILNSECFTTYFAQETCRRKLASMRDNLGWETASELERILIEQICLNWLRLNLLENVHRVKTMKNHSTETGLYLDKRLSSAQRRYFRACESLAKVRKYLAEAELKEQQARNSRAKSSMIANKLLKQLTET